MTDRVARVWIRLASLLVPGSRRREWRDTWMGDLWELSQERAPRTRVWRFALGAVPAALAELAADWSVSAMGGDLYRGWRRLVATPGEAAVAVLIVTIGVTANTSIFSIVNATLIRTPPGMADPDRLVQLGRLKSDGDFDNLSYLNYLDFSDRSTAYSGLAAYGHLTAIVGARAGATAIPIHAVTTNFFEVLGAQPALGRTFTAGDEQSQDRVVILSDAAWRRQFGARRELVGNTVLLDGAPFTVVGIAQPGFVGNDAAGAPPAAWVPLQSYYSLIPDATRLASRGNSWLWVVGRLAPGVSIEAARASTEALHAALARDNPGTLGPRIGVVAGAGMRPDERREAERISSLLMAVVGMVLLIACANVAGLLLARTSVRQRDMTVCAALGASRLRLVRELLAEQLIVSWAAAAAAWAVTWWSARAIQSILPYALAVTIEPDWRVFAFAVAISTVTSLLFGVLPARRGARVDVAQGLREDARGGGQRSARPWLAAVQLGLSFVLLIGAGLLLRSIGEARIANPGFAADAITAVHLNAELRRRESADAAASIFANLIDAARAMPGVAAVALASTVPIAVPQPTRSIWPAGADPLTDQGPPAAVLNIVSAEYFDTMGIPIVRGRGFRSDDPQSVAVLSESAAERLWPGEDPIGKSIDGLQPVMVVGIVRNVRLRSLSDRNTAALYVPFPSTVRSEMTLLVRTERASPRLVTTLVELARRTGPDVAIGGAGPLREMLGQSYAATQLVATLLVIFSGIAVTMAAAGVYVVLASWVSQKRRELAVRLALGATPADIRRLVLRRVFPAVAVGLCLGIPGALGATRVLQRLLFGVSPQDPVTYASAALVLVVVAAMASYAPARRAMRADPIETIKGV